MEEWKLDSIKSKLQEVRGLVDDIERIITAEEKSSNEDKLPRVSLPELLSVYVELLQAKKKGDEAEIMSALREARKLGIVLVDIE